MPDTLTPLVSSGKKNGVPPPTDYSHLKTYTAGEDNSRLAEMAKEFGLEHSRRPRKQVRDETAKGHRRTGSFYANFLGQTGQRIVQSLVTDTSVEVARMRAVYTLGYYPRRAGSFSEYGTTGDGLQSDSQRRNHHRQQSSMPEWLEEIELEEVDAHAQGVGGDSTSAVLGIIKGMVGPAILYLPHGLANAGYALAFPMILLSTCMFLYSSQCLLDAWKLEHSKKFHQPAPIAKRNEISTIAEEEDAAKEDQALLNGDGNGKENAQNGNTQQRFKMTFLSYPELAYRALGETGELTVKIGIAAMQSGVCLTYLIFVPQNFSTALHQLTGLFVSPEWFLVVMVAIQVPLSWIRDIRKLTLTNFLANVLILYGLCTCLVLSLQQAATTPKNSGAVVVAESPVAFVGERLANLAPFAKDWFLFIGTSVSTLVTCAS